MKYSDDLTYANMRQWNDRGSYKLCRPDERAWLKILA